MKVVDNVWALWLGTTYDDGQEKEVAMALNEMLCTTTLIEGSSIRRSNNEGLWIINFLIPNSTPNLASIALKRLQYDDIKWAEDYPMYLDSSVYEDARDYISKIIQD